MFLYRGFFSKKKKIHDENRRIVHIVKTNRVFIMRILVPLDLSSYQHSKVSVKFVLKHLVKPNESTIHFLTILPKKEVDEYSSEITQNASRCKSAQKSIEQWFKRMCEEKGVTCEIEAIELAKMTNRTISSIICERRNYTIVALAAHNRSGMAKFLLGSVCKSVLANSSIPACVVNTAPLQV